MAVKVYIVLTEDGEKYAFSTREKQIAFADQAIIEYATSCGISLTEAIDFASLEVIEVDKYA